MSITGDQSLLKQINRMALVRAVRRQACLSRADLAKETGLTKSTVSLLCQELIDEGWFLEHAVQATGALGRRPTPLSIDPRRLAMLGADLGVNGLHVVEVSLTGEILDSCSEPIAGGDPSAVLARLAQMLIEAVMRLRHQGRGLLGIGVGLPGAVDEFSGVLKVAPNLGWREVGVRDQLVEALSDAGSQIAIHVHNEADVAALGEFEFGDGEVPEPLIFLSLGIGVGAGIVVNDRLFVGANGFAGEVGHSILEVDGPLCSCGRHGCVEAFIGLNAIGQHIAGDQRKGLNLPEILALLASNDTHALAVVRDAGKALGVLIQNLWTMIDPGRVVLGGPACSLGPPFLDAVHASLNRFTEEAGLPGPDVRLARYGDLAVAVGAAALVLHKTTRPL